MPNASKDETGDAPLSVPCLQKLDSPAGSPTKAAPISAVLDLERCVSNLSLAHEIVVNRDFCFTQSRPPKESLEGRVMEMVHRAFWDLLGEQLARSPPDYSHAITLLQELKTTLLSLLLPGHVRLRAQLEEVLDLALIRQQAEQGALELPRLAGYVISTMGSLCAPVRDPQIRALRDLNDPVDMLRESFRVLGVMKTDMVNFTVQSLRPQLRQQAVQYERAKFTQILDQQPASLDCTTAWLRGAAQEEMSAAAPSGPEDTPPSTPPPPRGPVRPTAILNRAYLALLTWDPRNQDYPETVLMDRARLDALGQRLNLLVLEAAVLLLTTTQCGGAVLSLPGFVGKLKQTITALLEGSHSRASELQGALLGLGEQVLDQLREGVARLGGAPPSQHGLELLKGQILDLGTDGSPIRALIGARVGVYLRATLEASPSQRGAAPPRPPRPCVCWGRSYLSWPPPSGGSSTSTAPCSAPSTPPSSAGRCSLRGRGRRGTTRARQPPPPQPHLETWRPPP